MINWKCDSCKFWVGDEDAFDGTTYDLGYCYRYPPSPIKFERPYTGSGEWCGEHREIDQ